MKPEDYDGYKRTHYIPCEKGVKVRVIEFSPLDSKEAPILFIPGWVTRLEVMYEIIKIFLDKGFPVLYFESRDKKSSLVPPDLWKPSTFRVEKQAEDLRKTIEFFGFKSNNYYLFSSSYGCILASHMLSKPLAATATPKKIVLLVPTLHIRFTWWQKLLIRTPRILEQPAVTIVERYMRERYANPKEPEEHYKFKAQLYDFDIRKVQLTAIALDKYGASIKPFRGFNKRTLVIAASLDLLHPIENVKVLAKVIGGHFLDLLSNKFTHGELGGKVVSHFFMDEIFDPQPILSSDFNFQALMHQV